MVSIIINDVQRRQQHLKRTKEAPETKKMNIQIPISFLPTLLFLVLCIVPTSTILWIYKKQTERKKSPLNMEMLRSPGQSLNEQIQEMTYDILMYLFLIPTSSVLIYSIIITEYFSSGKQINLFTGISCLAAITGGGSYLFTKIFRLLKQRNHLRLGYDCELAVGQELNNRIRDGFFVFHDFPADGFNIDHILVGPPGVFAIETKGRAKSRVAENNNWKVKYDGNRLIFPTWTESRPLEQAKRQSQWLSLWLSKVTGAPCKVLPVLAIPGWWIDRTAPAAMPVYNGKDSSFLARKERILSPQQIKAVSHQIDRMCRTVEASSYKQDT